MIAHCSSGVMRQGAPERGASLKRSRAKRPQPALASQRPRHWLTVLRQTPKRSAAAVMLKPSAKSNTIRAREAALCAVEGERTRPTNSTRSASDKTRPLAETPIAILHRQPIDIENHSNSSLKTTISRVNISAKVN
jgi:hypothetical protein